MSTVLEVGFEAVWHLAQAPGWLGPSLIGGGLCAVSFLVGRVLP